MSEDTENRVIEVPKKPIYEMTREEKAAAGRKGQKKGAEVKRQKKQMRETMEILLGMKLRGKGKSPDLSGVPSVEGLKGKNLTVTEAIMVKQVQKALQGDPAAVAFIQALTGQKPMEVQQVEVVNESAEKLSSILKQLQE